MGVLLKDASAELETAFDKMGEEPWDLSPTEQYEIAKALYLEVLNPVREEYRNLARQADKLRSNQADYINLLMVMGASENILVYSWTIMDELARDEEKEKNG